MDHGPQKKVSDILKENSLENQLKILEFVRYKVGEEFKVSNEFNEKNFSSKMDKSIQSLKKEFQH